MLGRSANSKVHTGTVLSSAFSGFLSDLHPDFSCCPEVSFKSDNMLEALCLTAGSAVVLFLLDLSALTRMHDIDVLRWHICGSSIVDLLAGTSQPLLRRLQLQQQSCTPDWAGCTCKSSSRSPVAKALCACLQGQAIAQEARLQQQPCTPNWAGFTCRSSSRIPCGQSFVSLLAGTGQPLHKRLRRQQQPYTPSWAGFTCRSSSRSQMMTCPLLLCSQMQPCIASKRLQPQCKLLVRQHLPLPTSCLFWPEPSKHM